MKWKDTYHPLSYLPTDHIATVPRYNGTTYTGRVSTESIANRQVISFPLLKGRLSFPFSGFSVGFCINEEKVIWYQLELTPFAPMTTGAFSRNVGKLFSELKLVPDNLLFIQVG